MNILPWRLRRIYQPVWLRITNHRRLTGRDFTMGRPQLFKIEPGGAVELGKGVHFESGLRLHVRGDLKIGDDVYFGRNATIVCFSKVTIGDRTLIAENVSIHDEDHGGPGTRDSFLTAPISIGQDAWICAGSVITKGVDIGDEVTIGANAVVTHDIPTGHLGLGVPARAVRQRVAPKPKL